MASVKSLSGRIKSAPLVQLLSADLAPVAAATISGANLSDAEWAAIIPNLPVRARGFLRNRSDLGPKTQRALRYWSAADFALPRPAKVEVSVSSIDIGNGDAKPKLRSEKMRIGEIVERIERLRKDREEQAEIKPTPEPFNLDAINQSEIKEIRFETDEMGTVCWVEGAPRGALVGIGIAEPAFDDSPGPDAYGAAAFRQRMPLENARMRLCGAPAIEGEWRIMATPFFDSNSGRFCGYRGLLRRPNVAESPQIDRPVQNSDQLQQLVHELRTPLGAIIGFSEIIEQQLFGPVSREYRHIAQDIVQDAKRLLSGFDDLAMAANIESGRYDAGSGITECNWLANRLAERLHGLSDTLSVTLNLAKADPVRPFAIDSNLAERLFSRLLSAVMIGCDTDEQLSGRFYTERGHQTVNKFTLSLPRKLAGLSEEELLGSLPAERDDNQSAPLLGLGFSLRLVRNLARNVNGDLRFHKESLILILPASLDSGAQYRGKEKD
ncbi:MAG: hypothetical protein HC843_01215 [Sphingomonadales bacterium]|nr:hypothetical protein [Sphingomonadales bacterium]